jgi:hypothetical protein
VNRIAAFGIYIMPDAATLEPYSKATRRLSTLQLQVDGQLQSTQGSSHDAGASSMYVGYFCPSLGPGKPHHPLLWIVSSVKFWHAMGGLYM